MFVSAQNEKKKNVMFMRTPGDTSEQLRIKVRYKNERNDRVNGYSLIRANFTQVLQTNSTYMWRVVLIGGSRGLSQNFFIFMQFSEKIGQIIGWRPSGKSSIRHW